MTKHCVENRVYSHWTTGLRKLNFVLILFASQCKSHIKFAQALSVNRLRGSEAQRLISLLLRCIPIVLYY